MKRYDKVTRYSIKKYSVGVASVAVAAFVFFAGGEAQAADTNVETPATTTVENATPSVEGATSEDKTSATEEKTTESEVTPKGEEKEVSPVSEAPVGETNAEISTTNTTNEVEAPASSTENKEGANILAAENATTSEDAGKEDNLIPTPTPVDDNKEQAIKNFQYDKYKDLYKNGDLPGKFGLYLTGKDKDGNEVVSTAFGNTVVEKNLQDMNLRFVFQNDDADTNVLFDVVLPVYENKNSKFVVDAPRFDFDNGIKVTSKSGEDYSKNMTYSDIGGQYDKLESYKQLFPNYSTTTTLGAFYLQKTMIKANDIFSFDIPVKLLDVDSLTTPLSQSSTLIDFRNYAQSKLLTTFSEKAEALPDRKIQVQPTLVYLAPGGVEGGEFWDYSYLNDEIKDEIPKITDVYRFQRAIGGAERGINATLVTDENGKQYYVVKSLDSDLAKYNLTPTDIYFNLLNGTNSGTDEEKEKTSLIKILAKHGHTVNSVGYVNNSYAYSFSNSGAKVYNAPEGYEIEGVADDHIQINPAIITKNSTHIVDPTSTDWTVKDVLTQFSDPSVVKYLIKEDDENNWINDDAKLKEMKVSIVNTETNEEIKEEDFAKLKQKAGKYKVTASYIYDYTNKTTDDNYGKQKLEISNTGYVTVVTGKQKVEFKVIDNNDSQNPTTITTSEALEGNSGEAIDTAVLNNKKEQLVADYVAKGYKFVSNTALPTNFDTTENTVDNVDNEPQIVTITFVHDIEEKKEYSDAERIVTYVGAGERTPKQVATQEENVFVKTSKIDKVTKQVIGTPTTEGSYTFTSVDTPKLKGYTADKDVAGAGVATFENPKIEEIVTYTKNPDIKVNDSKDVVRIITITLPDGTTNKVEQKVTFTRTNMQDPVTDVVTNGEWNEKQQTLPAYVPTDYVGFSTKVVGSIAEEVVTPESANLNTTISYESSPIVKTEDVPFGTKYEEDATLDFGKTTEVPGVLGKKEVTTTYKFENGNSVAEQPTEKILVAPVDRVIKVGTKPTVVTNDVDFATEYEADDTLEYGQTKVKTEGTKGVDTITTTYKLVGDHAVENEKTTVRTIEPINKVILVGTKPSVVTKELAYKTIYKENTSLEAGEQKVIVEGKKGSEVTTTTYSLNTTTGEATPSIDTKSTPSVDKVIEVGTKEKVETESKNIPLRYEADNTLEKGQQVVEKEGKAGQKVTTITYKLNEQTGEVSENDPVVVETPSEERVIKVGTQPTSVITKQDYRTIYEADNTLAHGQRKVKQLGEKGVTTVVTTYTVDEKTGELTSHEQTPQVFAPQDEIILVGTQPTIETKDVDFGTEYVADSSLSFGEQVVVEGEKGELTAITTYKLDTTTGEVTVDKTTETQTKAPKNKVVKVGTQPKVEISEVAYQTIYEADDTLEYGQTKVKTEGVNGVETTTTTYKLDGENAVVDKTTTERTTEPTNKVIEVGTKPNVATKELPYKTIYKEDATLELGETKVEKVGVKGVETTTTTYILNTTTGEVTQSTKVETTDPINEVVLVGTKLKEEKHTYSYNFVSTSGQSLPKEVIDLAPKGGEYDATQALVPELPEKLEVETEKGTWKFVGYTPNEVLDFEDVVFVGEWNFAKKAEPITPPRPNKPEKPVTPPQPEKPVTPPRPEKPEEPQPQKPTNPKEPLNPSEKEQKENKKASEVTKQNEEVKLSKEAKKLPNTTSENNSELGLGALALTALTALGLKRRKENK